MCRQTNNSNANSHAKRESKKKLSSTYHNNIYIYWASHNMSVRIDMFVRWVIWSSVWKREVHAYNFYSERTTCSQLQLFVSISKIWIFSTTKTHIRVNLCYAMSRLTFRNDNNNNKKSLLEYTLRSVGKRYLHTYHSTIFILFICSWKHVSGFIIIWFWHRGLETTISSDARIRHDLFFFLFFLDIGELFETN